MEKRCYNCKFFTRTAGHGSSDWGYCNITNSDIFDDNNCERFEAAESDIRKKITPVKIEIIRRQSIIDASKDVFMVHVYDNRGELIDVTGFKQENAAGRYAFEIEQFYKFYKEM
jgi:hypothetical protein